MKKYLLQRMMFCMIVFSWPTWLCGQKNDNLAHDNGFMQFHFGDSVNNFGNSICEWDPVEELVRFKYCGNDSSILMIGDIMFDDVVLCFYKGELINISYSLYMTKSTTIKDFNKQQEFLMNKLSDILDSLYGKSREKPESDYGNIKTWCKGNAVILLSMSGGGDLYWCRIDVAFKMAKSK